MSTNTSYNLTPNSQKLLVDFVKSRFLSFSIQTTRNRYENIDRALQLENVERRKILEDYYSDTEIAIAAEPVNTATSFLTSIYLQKAEVFEVVTKNKDLMPVAQQIQALNQENAKATSWEREFPLYFRDCTKYNFGAIEILWEAEQTQVIGTTTGSGAASAIDTVLREGNNITRRDPYNSFYDTMVPINEVHKRGEFSGYIERISMIDLAITVEKLQVSGESQTDNPIMNKEKLFNQSLQGITNQYFEPAIRTEVRASTEGANSMSSFFGLGSIGSIGKKDERMLALNKYEIVTCYVRIIPSMFNMNGIPGATKPQIWKLKIVNWDTLIFAEKQTNAHNFFGLITTQVLDEGIQDQNKSIAELLIPIQNLSTKIHDARMQGLRRNISDRAIYVQGVIDKSHIDNNSPTAKIPMRPSLIVKSARDAYHAIPYNDNLGATILQELQYLEHMADKTSSTNAPQRGQFQKGNKTLGEFSEVMSNADANMRAMALLLEASSMSPIKTMLMTNILQYSPPQELTNSDTGEVITLDPVALRKAKLEFRLADGLRTKETLLGVDGLNTFMTMILQVPELNVKYDITDVIGYIFGVEGINIKQFERTPEEQASRQAPPDALPPPVTP